MPILTTVLQIKINGTAIASDDITDVRVERSIGVASRATMRFRYAMATWSYAIGQACEISVISSGGGDGSTGAATVVFVGEIVGVGVDAHFDGAELTVEAFDKSHRLNKATKTRVFKDQSFSDMVSTIAGEIGLSGSAHSSLGSTVHKYYVQTGTAHALLSEICLRTGCEWYVDGTNLKVQPRGTTAGPTLKWGEGLRRFRVRYSAGDTAWKVKVKAWDPAAKAAISGESTASAVEGTNAPVFNGASADKTAFAEYTLETSSLPGATAAEANSIAKGLLTRMATGKILARGELDGLPSLKPGELVTVEGAGPKLNGKYYVTAVEHLLGQGMSFITRFTAGGLEPTSIVDLLGNNDRNVAGFGQLGVVVGVVSNNDQASGDGKPGPGNVFVKLPTLGPDIETGPARLVSPEAGAGRGTYNVPEIDDEVLVAFEHGDLRRPYVLGAMWNGSSAPPTINGLISDNKVMARQWKSRLGHTFTFNDGSSDEKKNLTVLLADGKTTLMMSHKKIDLIAADGNEVTISNGSSKATITLKANGDIEMKGNNIKLDAQAKVTILAKSDVEVTPTANFKVNATAGVEIKGNSPCKFESSAIVSIKGAMVKLN